MIDKDLQAVGLQEKEAKVYLAALELDKGTAQQIAIKAELKRPTTYVIMEELMRQGLVSSFYEGKKQYFVAENPERLVDILQNQKQDVEKREVYLQSLLPQLQSINNRQKDKPVVKYYEGKDGVASMIRECNRVNRGKKLFLLRNDDIALSTFGKDLTNDLASERAANDVFIKQIYTSEQYSPENVSMNEEAIWVSNKDFPVMSDIAIYEDRVRIIDFKSKLIGVVIESREIAQSFKTMHNLAWKHVESMKDAKK